MIPIETKKNRFYGLSLKCSDSNNVEYNPMQRRNCCEYSRVRVVGFQREEDNC